MEFIKFLYSRVFLKNLLIAIIIALVLIFGTLWGLGIYTKHGEMFPVPSLKEIHFEEAIRICVDNDLRYSIYDSVYVSGKEGGIVVDQFPDSGFMVKDNRNIYLTISSYETKMVAIPNLIDESWRKAQGILLETGIVVGKITYEPSYANNTVRRLFRDSIEVFAGDLVPFHSALNVVLGKNSDEKTLVPNLISMHLDSATTVLNSAYLNVGLIIFDETIETNEDSLTAQIFKQKPIANNKSTINLGKGVDVWLTNNKTKIEVDTIFLQISDSLDIENNNNIQEED